MPKYGVLLSCNKQHLSKILSPIHEEVTQHWGWDEKSVAYKKACIWYRKLLDLLETWSNSISVE